jgi:hypothetical protein
MVSGNLNIKHQTFLALISKIIDLSSYDSDDDRIIGKAPEFIDGNKVCNYNKHLHGILVSPPHSTRVYREPAVEQAFMLLLLLVALGELFSSPAIVSTKLRLKFRIYVDF